MYKAVKGTKVLLPWNFLFWDITNFKMFIKKQDSEGTFDPSPLSCLQDLESDTCSQKILGCHFSLIRIKYDK